MLDRQHRVERVQLRGPNRIVHRPTDFERVFVVWLVFFAPWQLFHRPQIDNEFFEHLAKTDHTYALAQMLIIFRSAFMALGLPRVSNIDYIDDVALFIKSKAAIATHVFPLSLVATDELNLQACGGLIGVPARSSPQCNVLGEA